MRVRKVMKEKKAPKKTIFDSKEKIIGFSIATAVLALLLALIMFIELKEVGELIVKNDTDMRLEYVSTKYISGEADLSKTNITESIDAGKTFRMKIDPFKINGYSANYNISFKFKGHDKLYVDAGLFNSSFAGDIKIVFSKTKDPNKLKMTVKAYKGITATSQISCDEVYTVDFKKGIVFD